MMQSRDPEVEADIRNNKIKQGFLIKRSRVLKEWRKRWIVLTTSHLYSFEDKSLGKRATEKIPLKDVTTIKSFYQNQYERPEIIRVESQDTQFYFSADNHQVKWAWMTAIEKMTYLATSGKGIQVKDSQAVVRETLRTSSVNRGTFAFAKKRQEDATREMFKKLKLIISPRQVEEMVISQKAINQQGKLGKEDQSQGVTKVQVNEEDRRELPKVEEQTAIEAVQPMKQVERVVYVDRVVEKIVEVQKIVEVEKIVYRDSPAQVDSDNGLNTKMNQPKLSQQKKKKIQGQLSKYRAKGGQSGIDEFVFFFEELLLENQLQRPQPLIDFIVMMGLSKSEKYQEAAITFSLSSSCHRFFAELLLYRLNEIMEEENLNQYVRFITLLYEVTPEYFYGCDCKILLDIVLRQLEYNHSDLNQLLNLELLLSLLQKQWWPKLRHREDDLKLLVQEISTTSSEQNCIVAFQILQKL